MGKLYVIGIGPGGLDEMTLRAVKAIEESDIIVGYTNYIEMVKDLIKDKEIFKTGMRGEEERCREARDRSAAFSNYISSSFCGIMTRLTSAMVKFYNYSAPSSTVYAKHQLAQKYPSRLKTAALI